MNANLKSALLGIAIAIPVSLLAIHHQNLNAEAHRNDFRPVYEPVPCEIAEPETKPETGCEKAEIRCYEVPLADDLQVFLIQICEEYHISPALVIAVIEQESQYNASAVGDGGNSVGLMQIQERWHRERMDRLGCTDLTNPYQNIAVGVDLLAELYGMNPDTYWVLMAYNGGIEYANNMIAANTYSTYAVEVTTLAAELERNTEDLMNY